MKNIIFNKLRKFQILKLFRIQLGIVLLLVNYTCDKSSGPNQTQDDLMAVYPNRGNVITIVDYSTLDFVKQIIVSLPESFYIDRMCLSSDRDYFVFIASLEKPPFSSYIVNYDVNNNAIQNIFPIGLDSVGAPRLTAAYIPEEPSLIYLYSHNVGLYSIDFITRQIDLISNECDQSLGKLFYFSSDKKSLAILEQHGSEPAYSKIVFYNTLSRLQNFQFILNQNNLDSIQIDDLAFSDEGEKIFISIRVPQMRDVANYFGSYDLERRKLYKSSLIFPWSLNPYYLAYSPKRKECYLVGAQDKFYIIGTDSADYYLKAVVNLTGKNPSPSRILVRPDENVAFVSCVYSNFVIAIDLENRKIIKTIPIEAPYLMVLL